MRTTRYPPSGSAYEHGLHARVAAVLENGEDPDPHLAAVIGLLSARGALPGPTWSSQVGARGATRAGEIERGDWGAAAVGSAVVRTMAAAVSATAASAAVPSLLDQSSAGAGGTSHKRRP